MDTVTNLIPTVAKMVGLSIPETDKQTIQFIEAVFTDHIKAIFGDTNLCQKLAKEFYNLTGTYPKGYKILQATPYFGN